MLGSASGCSHNNDESFVGNLTEENLLLASTLKVSLSFVVSTR